MLQVVIFTDVRQEDMHQHVSIVHCYPLGILKTYHMGGLFVQLFSDHIADRLGDGLHLRWGVTRADDEILADGAFYLRQIGNDNILAFLI